VHAQDDAFHEIQLNGKQLVFVFMVATVASVVIFLCGVFVGRGVRAERSGSDETASLIEAPAADVVPPKSAALNPPAQGADPRAAAPPPATDDQSYVDRLEKKTAPSEELKQPPPVAQPAPAPPSAPAAASTAQKAPSLTAQPDQKATSAPAAKASATTAQADTKASPASAQKDAKAPTPALPEIRPDPPSKSAPQAAANKPTPAESKPAAAPQTRTPAPTAAPGAQGFVVQVAALNAPGEADAIVKKLTSKGYAAFVQPPVSGSAAVYRVRVGPVGTRQEADVLAAKLQKEEHFKPWVTR
jgi:DedD protein